MKAFTTNLNMLAVFALLAITFSMTSCKEDPITGCTDQAAENYNELAEESDGNCTYARDKFLGDYLGSLSCPGLLDAISTDSLTFNIAESVSGPISDVGVTLNNIAVTINGTVTGSSVVFDSEILDRPFDANDDGIPDFNVDLKIIGSATIDDTETIMTGELDITAVATITQVALQEGVCQFTGTKQ